MILKILPIYRLKKNIRSKNKYLYQHRYLFSLEYFYDYGKNRGKYDLLTFYMYNHNILKNKKGETPWSGEIPRLGKLQGWVKIAVFVI